MKVFVCAPVRNRAWILNEYAEAILKQNIEIETCFLVNDCEDNSESILESYGFGIKHMSFKDKTESHERGSYSFNHLAVLRNQLIDYFLESDCDVFMSIDSDIIIPDNSIEKLLVHDKDIISMLIKNNPTIHAYNVMNNGRHLYEVPKRGILEADVTGAVYAVKRKVLEAGVRYGWHRQGEDVAFCKQAKELGFGIYCDTNLRPTHAYDKNTRLIAEVR